MRFQDRAEAGQRLAERLAHLAADAPVVLALPRGGVPVAVEIARELKAPMDLVLVRKVGAPGRAELAAGAVGENGVTVRNPGVLRELGMSWTDLADRVDRERAELMRRGKVLRHNERITLTGRTVIIVDDGIATGSTVVAALRVVRGLGARRVVLAVPVAPADTMARLAELADEVVCLQSPAAFRAVGQWFHDFSQVSDDEVRAMLRSHDTDA